jgi:hypothetical protein
VLTVEAAIACAARAHAGQKDKAGAPYLFHPLRVMLALETEEERIVALLHDVAEDAGWAALEELGELPAPIAAALDALTHRAGETYSAYLGRVAAVPLARRVKVADLRDNLDPNRIRNPGPADVARSLRYRSALEFLLGPS